MPTNTNNPSPLINQNDVDIINNIIASAKIEGLTPNPDVVCDMQRICLKEISYEQAILNITERLPK